MHTRKHRDKAPTGAAWRDDILNTAFEIYLGVSRLMAALQIGPPKLPRKTRLLRRDR
jgi:hypothetical protein